MTHILLNLATVAAIAWLYHRKAWMWMSALCAFSAVRMAYFADALGHTALSLLWACMAGVWAVIRSWRKALGLR